MNPWGSHPPEPSPEQALPSATPGATFTLQDHPLKQPQVWEALVEVKERV